MQIDAWAGGSERYPLSQETQHSSIQTGLKMYGEGGSIEIGLAWPALLRQPECIDGTGYRV